ncbi:unnamed protein product [Brassicogethes aeneus]|uniref:Uncharacterized protein n=1 Tax=Brassicogethes aeneus TaxID=1431903 RepID=A0A9P0FBH4_BRAAE|nr:unnamed protein product [Brassicogethes aeneus]
MHGKNLERRWSKIAKELLNIEQVNREEEEEINENIEEKEQNEQKEFNTKSVADAVKRLKRGKSAGHDGITAEMLTNLGNNGLEVLTQFINRVAKEEHIPNIHTEHCSKGAVIDESDHLGLGSVETSMVLIRARNQMEVGWPQTALQSEANQQNITTKIDMCECWTRHRFCGEIALLIVHGEIVNVEKFIPRILED